eukprot:4430171-Prorocentrum_lima.AAC.1
MVVIFGLQSADGRLLNRTQGAIVKYSEEKERYQVQGINWGDLPRKWIQGKNLVYGALHRSFAL